MCSLNGQMFSVMFAFGLAAVLLVATVPATAQVPSLEGTTYGDMLQDLDRKVRELDRASGMDEERKLKELVLLIAHQNRTMIRMIDGLHKQVKGLVSQARSREQIEQGQKAFEAASRVYQGAAGPGR